MTGFDDNFPVINGSDNGTGLVTKLETRRVRRQSRIISDLTEADSPYTMTDWETDTVVCALSTAGLTINLPAPSTENQGWAITFKARALNGQTVTVDSGSGQFIDAAQTKTLTTNYDSFTIFQYGTRWLTI